MNNEMEAQSPSVLPGPADYKKSQTNILAELIPQIMNAMGGGDPYTTKVLQQQAMAHRQRADAADKQNRMRGFMRSVAMPATGNITPDLIMQQAELWGVDPADAMRVVNGFQKFRQGKQNEGFTLSAGQTRYGADGSVLASMPGGEPMPYTSSRLGVLDKRTGEIVHRSPEEQPSLQKVPDGMGGWKFVRPTEGLAGLNNPPKGMRIQTGPEGTVIQTNVSSGGGVLTPATKSQVQKGLLEAVDTYDGVRSAWSRYDDSYLMGRDKLGFNITAFKEKWDLGEIAPGEKRKLEEYTKFKRDSISSLNNYIKQVTGAAMSQDEAKRLMKGMPNPGMGMFDGDSPTEFKAKMEATMQQLGRVIARAKYVLNSDLGSYADISLDQMDGIIDARGEELEESMKKQYPEKSDKDITLLVTHALSQEFGVKL